MKNRIKEIMLGKNLTNRALARKIGMSEVGIGGIINNKNEGSANSLQKIADALEVEFWELFVAPEDAARSMQEKGILPPASESDVNPEEEQQTEQTEAESEPETGEPSAPSVSSTFVQCPHCGKFLRLDVSKLQ